MIAFLKDLIQMLGTDWRMWMMFLLAIILVFYVVKWVARISGWLLH